MKKLAIICAVFVVTALFSVSTMAQAKTEEKKDSALLATWNLTISAPGQELPGTFKFEKDGDNFKGVVATDLGEIPLSSGEIIFNRQSKISYLPQEAYIINDTLKNNILFCECRSPCLVICSFFVL